MCDSSLTTTRERTFTGGSVGSFACYFNNHDHHAIPQRVVVTKDSTMNVDNNSRGSPSPPMRVPVSPGSSNSSDSTMTMASPTHVQGELDYSQKLHMAQLEKEEALQALQNLSEGIQRITRRLKYREAEGNNHEEERFVSPPTSPPRTMPDQSFTLTTPSTIQSPEIESRGMIRSEFDTNNTSELLLALSEASQMVMEHERMAAKEASLLVQDIQIAHEQVQDAKVKQERAKRVAKKLIKKNKSLQSQVDQLTMERKILAQEIMVLRQNRQEEALRLMEHHVLMHELQLKYKQQQERHDRHAILGSQNENKTNIQSATPINLGAITQTVDHSTKDNNDPQMTSNISQDNQATLKNTARAVPHGSDSPTDQSPPSKRQVDVAEKGNNENNKSKEKLAASKPTTNAMTVTEASPITKKVSKISFRNGFKFGEAMVKKMSQIVPDLEEEYSAPRKSTLNKIKKEESTSPKQPLVLVDHDNKDNTKKEQQKGDEQGTTSSKGDKEMVTLAYRPLILHCDTQNERSVAIAPSDGLKQIFRGGPGAGGDVSKEKATQLAMVSADDCLAADLQESHDHFSSVASSVITKEECRTPSLACTKESTTLASRHPPSDETELVVPKDIVFDTNKTGNNESDMTLEDPATSTRNWIEENQSSTIDRNPDVIKNESDMDRISIPVDENIKS